MGLGVFSRDEGVFTWFACAGRGGLCPTWTYGAGSGRPVQRFGFVRGKAAARPAHHGLGGGLAPRSGPAPDLDARAREEVRACLR